MENNILHRPGAVDRVWSLLQLLDLLGFEWVRTVAGLKDFASNKKFDSVGKRVGFAEKWMGSLGKPRYSIEKQTGSVEKQVGFVEDRGTRWRNRLILWGSRWVLLRLITQGIVVEISPPHYHIHPFLLLLQSDHERPGPG